MSESPTIENLNENESELTMCDVLEEEQELEDDANAVLGGSDDTNCSYDKGYVSRQALYACLTCSTDHEPSGICLACSYKCHDGHEIVELYTKRNFRCDCGNSKFDGKTCSLKPDKDPINSLNKYNQNFKGLYCSCSRPYPDMEDNVPDEMIQCIMCEDWFHARHIGDSVPDDYFEMICTKCMESHPFLYYYLTKLNHVEVDDKPEMKSMNNGLLKNECENNFSVKNESDCGKLNSATSSTTDPSESSDNKADVSELKMHFDSKVKTENISNCENSAGICLLNQLQSEFTPCFKGPAFWPENWRKELCYCASCLEMYCKNDCGYLINVDDTILAYEEKGKTKNESQYDKGMSALSQMDRVGQMEAIRAYTSMKGQLKEYLKEFANNKRTVSESDIKEFFDRISKRQKVNQGVPHFCR